MTNRTGNKHWNRMRSILLSKIIIITFGIILLFFDIRGYWIIGYLLRMSPANMFADIAHPALMVYLYVCSLPAFVVLVQLYTLLVRITKGDIFTTKNVACLRLVSWCCIFVGIISTFLVVVWPSVALVALAAGLAGLILRIVKNVFEQAVDMKDELDYTV